MMLKRISILIFINLISYAEINSQIPQFSQYMINGFLFNSAMAGSDGYTSFNLATRQQWVGISDAPRTISLSMQTRVLKRSYIIKREPVKQENKFIPARTGRVGLGLNIYSDRNGIFSNTGVTMSYAYHIPFPNAQLSFGISGTISQLKVDLNSSDYGMLNQILHQTDNTLIYYKKPFYIPDANVGIFYSNRKFYSGFSVAELFQSYLKFGSGDIGAFQLKRSYYIIAGYHLDNQVNIAYEPSILIKTTEQFFPQVDLSFKAYFYENYWMGLSYRTANTMIFFLGIRKNKFYISYSFDYSFNTLQNFTFGTHELNIAVKFGDSVRRYRWLNRY